MYARGDLDSLLSRVNSPADLRRLDRSQLDRLSQEIRDFLVKHVSETGGHLSPNLGVVELTLAMHRVFDSPRDAIVWDTGHQAYVHKLVTGRREDLHHPETGRRHVRLSVEARERA